MNFACCRSHNLAESRLFQRRKGFPLLVQSWPWSKGRDRPDPMEEGFGLRRYEKYLAARERLFDAFPQIDTEVLEEAARQCSHNDNSFLCDRMAEFSRMVEELETPKKTIRSYTLNAREDWRQFAYGAKESGHPWGPYLIKIRRLFVDAGGDRSLQQYREDLKLSMVAYTENPSLRANYAQCRHRLEKKLGCSIKREYILYHGTASKRAESILRDGFDPAKIQSCPYGFYLCNDPGVALRHCGPHGVVVVCRVLVGVTALEPKMQNIVGNRSAGPSDEVDCFIRDAGAERTPAVVAANAAKEAVRWALMSKKGVPRRVFIVQRPDQILPVAALRFTHPRMLDIDWLRHSTESRGGGEDSQFDLKDFKIEPSPRPRLVTAARLNLDEVDSLIDKLQMRAQRDGRMSQQTRREIDSKTKQMARLKEDYETRRVCPKCGLENTKLVLETFLEVLRWAEPILNNNNDDGKIATVQTHDEVESDDYFEEDEEDEDEQYSDQEVLYESEGEETGD